MDLKKRERMTSLMTRGVSFFQLVCLNCDFVTNNLKDLKVHLKTICPYRETLPYNLLCGHCEYRAKIWPAFVRHLNHKDMQLASPKNRLYAYPPRETTAMASKSLPAMAPRSLVPPTVQKDSSASKSMLKLTPPPIAKSSSPVVAKPTCSDVEPDSPPRPPAILAVSRAILEKPSHTVTVQPMMTPSPPRGITPPQTHVMTQEIRRAVESVMPVGSSPPQQIPKFRLSMPDTLELSLIHI